VREWDVDRVARAAGARVIYRPRDAPELGDGPGDGPGDRLGARPAAKMGGARPGGAEMGGAPPGPVRVSIDSRAVAPGDLFVGLRGERADGGEYAAQALQAGAWGVLAAPEHALAAAAIARDAGAGGYSGAVLADPDPLVGLQSLARAWLGELRTAGARVVGITGSTGKTSTKDILAALLSAPAGVADPSGGSARGLRTVASPENFNTEIGLALAILAAPAGTEALVLEMAMRGPGQIAELAAIAEPDVGVIVNVGPVHLQLLGSLEAVAAAKAELIAGLPPGASAIVPAGESLLEPYLREDLRTVTFGVGGDVTLARRSPDGQVTIVDRTHPGEPERIVLRPSFEQEHNLSNLLAAVAAAKAVGKTPEGEVSVRFSAMRGQRKELRRGSVLIEDCYNANPMSMRAAIDDLAKTASGRRVAVLGDMLELGAQELRYHREIGEYASERGVDVLVTVGPLAAEMAPSFAGEAHSVPDAPAAADLLEGLLAAGDTVLVKGSRGVGLERVAEALAQVPTGGG
jgi:UDP-N-acetylmuramoyl-tripeptide--D-alanyl-D-alanine ligase